MDNFIRTKEIDNSEKKMKRRPQARTISTHNLIPANRDFKNKEDVDKFMKKFNAQEAKKVRPKKEERENGD